ncbi:DUF1566 domain-containing protein, partial [candidate division KSB1 bacterium]|nr:DUF1566 domain-containing protein [candidate division KSB1 bacterium]
MAKLSKEQLDLGLVDKLYQNVIETGRIVRRLFVTFFTLMLVLSALAFDPEIFSADTPLSQPTAKSDSLTTDLSLAETQDPAAKRNQAAVRSEPAITLFGVKIARGTILKYSSLLLAMVYLMLTTYLIYMDFLRNEFFGAYKGLYAHADEQSSALLAKIRFPSFHYILGDLAVHHSSRFVQFIYQSVNVIKSLLLYVLPMFVVIQLLGEGVRRASSMILKVLFFLSPALVIVGTIAVTREWFIETWVVLKELGQGFLSIFSTQKPAGTKKKTFLSRLRVLVSVTAAIATILLALVPSIQFVKSSGFLSAEKVKAMLSDKNLYDRYWNPNATGIVNQFELKEINGDSVVFDLTTNLTWQQSGSGYTMNYESAQVYIDSLNSVGFASYNNWRLPTLEEAMSLMEPERKNDGL